MLYFFTSNFSELSFKVTGDPKFALKFVISRLPVSSKRQSLILAILRCVKNSERKTDEPFSDLGLLRKCKLLHSKSRNQKGTKIDQLSSLVSYNIDFPIFCLKKTINR